MATEFKKRILTGDTPTGRLHLGHWVGSLENRVALQQEYDCYFIIANVHALTSPSRLENPQDIRESVMEITKDYLAAGIDPKQSTIFLQSEIPAIAELTFIFAMLLPFNRVLRNPTLKDEIRDKGLGDNYSFGFPMYAVGQTADILSFRPELVPVGEDQLPHLELTREVARRFDQLYCNVDPHTEDKDYVKAGGLLPVIQPKLGRVKRLVGTGGPSAETGQLLKMSKSLNNSIFLSDTPDEIKKKVMSMYTDPTRKRASDPGHTENNPLWIFHETFNPDTKWVQETEEKYRAGQIGDVDCKRKLVDVLVALTEPMRQRRAQVNDDTEILKVLKEGTSRANVVAEETLYLVKQAIKQDYFARELKAK